MYSANKTLSELGKVLLSGELNLESSIFITEANHDISTLINNIQKYKESK
jgi:hypothetical protein